jgi:hypothetical protein
MGGVPAVAVTHLPVTPCQICRRTVACRPGKVRHVLTGALPGDPHRMVDLTVVRRRTDLLPLPVAAPLGARLRLAARLPYQLAWVREIT